MTPSSVATHGGSKATLWKTTVLMNYFEIASAYPDTGEENPWPKYDGIYIAATVLLLFKSALRR